MPFFLAQRSTLGRVFAQTELKWIVFIRLKYSIFVYFRRLAPKALFVKKLIAQFMKFGIVGVIAFLIDYGLMVALTEFFGVLSYLNTISFTVSVVFVPRRIDARYVFERRDDMSRRREFIIFVVLSHHRAHSERPLHVAVRKRLVHRLPYREDHRDSFGGYLEFCHAKDLLREALTQKH